MDIRSKEVEAESGDPLAAIQKLREDITASGNDHLSDYWIETIEFKTKKVLLAGVHG